MLVCEGKYEAGALAGRRVVLGIDPGIQVMGYGAVCGDGAESPLFVVAGAERLTGIADHYERLGTIYRKVQELISVYSPAEMAIEAPFLGKNAQSMLKLGRAQGVAIASAIGSGIEITEYSPRKIKLAVTGNGEASKEQIAAFLGKVFPRQGLEELKYLDATDGLAVALCHYFKRRLPATGRGRAWRDFIAQNPGRVRRG